jgi:hypothetical protein
MNRTIPLQIAILLMLSAFIASSQISFTGTYNFSYSPHRSIHMTCCENGSPVQFGLTSVIHDIPVAGPGVQITSLIITGTVQVASPDITNNAPFDWEVFIGSSPSTLPVGQVTGNPGNISSTALYTVSWREKTPGAYTVGLGSWVPSASLPADRVGLFYARCPPIRSCSRYHSGRGIRGKTRANAALPGTPTTQGAVRPRDTGIF